MEHEQDRARVKALAEKLEDSAGRLLASAALFKHMTEAKEVKDAEIPKG